MQKLVNTDGKDSQVLQHTGVKLTVYTCQRAEELNINICEKKKISRLAVQLWALAPADNSYS